MEKFNIFVGGELITRPAFTQWGTPLLIMKNGYRALKPCDEKNSAKIIQRIIMYKKMSAARDEKIYRNNARLIGMIEKHSFGKIADIENFVQQWPVVDGSYKAHFEWITAMIKDAHKPAEIVHVLEYLKNKNQHLREKALTTAGNISKFEALAQAGLRIEPK